MVRIMLSKVEDIFFLPVLFHQLCHISFCLDE